MRASKSYPQDQRAIAFCDEFRTTNAPRYVFGCNDFGRSIAAKTEIDGFVDDYVNQERFFSKPVLRSDALPRGAKVVSAIVGVRPLTAMKRLETLGVSSLDYFAFQKYSGLDLKAVPFISGFEEDYSKNRHLYDGVYQKLSDAESRRIFERLVDFRLSRDLKYMEGFVDAQKRQYFEPFLNLKASGETFLDVGCFDGFTTEAFIKRCPGYQSAHVFEPEPSNMARIRSRLNCVRDIHYHSCGASDTSRTLRFRADGSSSTFSDDGSIEVRVDRIDHVVATPFSLLKMDIEGAELSALEGARDSILKHHPRLAICVYHRADHLRKIPALVLSMRQDYEVFLRHYTEGVTETVMFFVPPEHV